MYLLNVLFGMLCRVYAVDYNHTLCYLIMSSLMTQNPLLDQKSCSFVCSCCAECVYFHKHYTIWMSEQKFIEQACKLNIVSFHVS